MGSSLPVLALLFAILCTASAVVASPCLAPLLFAFGDSNTDTGGYSVVSGTIPKFPEGRTFFHQPTGRLCDGRLIIDFLCESLGATYLTPYLELFTPDFSNGANFALAGSDTLRRKNHDVPYTLSSQIAQFSFFRNVSLNCSLMSSHQFGRALYLFDIGQNDIDGNIDSRPFDRFLRLLPSVVTNIKEAIQTIYGLGGRKFWIHNVGPVGCLPRNVANRNASKPLDANGCIARANEATVELNTELEKLCGDLRSEMGDATIVYVDVHAIKLDLIVNSAYYGFGDAFRACFNKAAGTVCSEEEATRFVSWDGVHYTEAANMLVASKVLSTKYSNPPLDFNFFCN